MGKLRVAGSLASPGGTPSQTTGKPVSEVLGLGLGLIDQLLDPWSRTRTNVPVTGNLNLRSDSESDGQTRDLSPPGFKLRVGDTVRADGPTRQRLGPG